MQLTAHELTAASSAVAALAIAGGYLGVRSANRTAVAIAREERFARRASDLDALKRVAYSEFLVALSKLADDQMAFDAASRYAKGEADEIWQRSVDSAQAANDRLAQLALVAPRSICVMAEGAFKRALKATEDDVSAVAADGEDLTIAMRADLETE
jgi:hypothetical protein